MKSRALYIFDALLLAAIFAVPLAWLLDPLRINIGPLHLTVSWGWKPVIAPLLLLTLRAGIRRGRSGLLERSAVRKALLAILMPWGFLWATEYALALAGVEPALAPVVIRGENDKDGGGLVQFVRDADLGWMFKPGGEFRGRTVNSLGFLDREVSAQKAAGTRRVICMGDSCTAQGEPPYAGYLNALLTNAPLTSETWEAFNVGVHGFSSFQGLKLFRLRVKDLQPDLVTIYFGWNDHWIASKPDSIKYGRVMNPRLGTLVNALHRKRLYGILVRVLQRDRPEEAKPLQVRVPPGEYTRNLEQLVDEIREAGAVPLLITAPRGPQIASQIVRNNKSANMEEILALHDRYCELTRQVARDHSIELLDLASVLSNSTASAAFSGDGIHFRQPGLERVAVEIQAKLIDMAGRGTLRSP